MSEKNVAFPFKEQQDILNKKCGYVITTSTFTSGTTKTTDTGFEEVEVGTILKDSTKVYFISAINDTTKVITGIALN